MTSMIRNLHGRSSSTARTKEPQCLLDPAVVNEDTVSKFHDIGLSFFASLCGRNRGVFVTTPADGKSYSCLSWPESFAAKAGIPEDVVITDSNSVKAQYLAGNITAAQCVDMLDQMTEAVYLSSPDVNMDPYACNVDGLAKLVCPDAKRKFPFGHMPLRSVTLAGLFAPAPWATQGKTLTASQAESFYTSKDFAQMKELGLNTVQIDILETSVSDRKYSHALSHVIYLARKAGLQVLIGLIGPLSNDRNVEDVASYCEDHSDAVIGLILPGKDSDVKEAARSVAKRLPLFVRINGGDVQHFDNGGDSLLFAALDISHSSVVADVASSTSVDDRMKMFYHEAVSCNSRSPLEYMECYKHTPAYVVSGFDLSIDNCIHHYVGGTKHDDPVFHNYGQCDRFDETIGSGWWARHRASFAARQLFSFEQGLGWSFATWKIYGDDAPVGSLDKHNKLMALRDVAAAGLFPTLNADEAVGAIDACLNPPATDFILGDATLAPTRGPPPDCGNGWWNYDLNACEYWIPPVPAPTTSVPTVRPTIKPTSVPCPACPVCPTTTDVAATTEVQPDVAATTEDEQPVPDATPPAVGVVVMDASSAHMVSSKFVSAPLLSGMSHGHQELAAAAAAGAIMALMVSAVVYKLMGRKKRNQGYQPIPN